MKLPLDDKLSVNVLSSCFKKTSASYKYFWFLSILQSVKSGQIQISKRELFSRMIANAWYSVNYFRLSFGSQDKLFDAILNIKDFERIKIDGSFELIFNKLLKTKNKKTINQLDHFDNQVPHWFLTPWLPALNKKEIYSSSLYFKNNCLYKLSTNQIEINPLWVDYLLKNNKILEEFCYWNLSLFLQSKNPSVPAIPDKILKPIKRNSLIKPREKFWDIIIKELGPVTCIYTGQRLGIKNYDIDHFVPYSFVCHDLIWNLIPAHSDFNKNVKKDKLPRLDLYFDEYSNLHKKAIDLISKIDPKNKLLAQYLTLFNDIVEINRITKEKFKILFLEKIQPLVSIASNNGFIFLNNY